jgi:hypothetical protein
MRENRDGYQQLGVQVAGLLTALASVLKQAKGDEEFEIVTPIKVNKLLQYVLLDDAYHSHPHVRPGSSRRSRRGFSGVSPSTLEPFENTTAYPPGSETRRATRFVCARIRMSSRRCAGNFRISWTSSR